MKKDATTTIGLDLGDRKSHLCVLDEEGEVIEESRVRTREVGLRGCFGSRARTRVALEVGTHSPWVSRLLEELGHEVVVANPRRVRLISESERKNDRVDAETLARLARMDPKLLRAIRHRTRVAQVDLEMVRARAALVRARSLLINHVRGAVKSTGFRLPMCSAERFGKVEESVPEGLREALGPVLESVRQMSESIRELDQRIEARAREAYPEVELLQSVPGVGPVTAMTYVLTLEDPNRFHSGRAVGAYLGLVPGQKQSGGRDPR